jgi:elongation factor 1-alpha|tara:strand:+ start:187 stop:534 length:348 start_codon:yes stop_codon:yes gene_type:complete
MYPKFPRQSPEDPFGNKEYKLKILKDERKNIVKKATQMLFRLYEGTGKAIYIIGIEDSGTAKGISHFELSQSIKNLTLIAGELEAQLKDPRFYKGTNGYIATIRVYKDLFRTGLS